MSNTTEAVVYRVAVTDVVEFTKEIDVEIPVNASADEIDALIDRAVEQANELPNRWEDAYYKDQFVEVLEESEQSVVIASMLED